MLLEASMYNKSKALINNASGDVTLAKLGEDAPTIDANAIAVAVAVAIDVTEPMIFSIAISNAKI